MGLEGVSVAATEKSARTETKIVLCWVDGDTETGFFQYSWNGWVRLEVGESRSTLDMTGLVDKTFRIHVAM